MSLKGIIRPFVRPIGQWAPIGLPAPQHEVVVFLRDHPERGDLTASHTIASLRPLTLAIDRPATPSGETGVLDYFDGRTRRLLGWLNIRQVGDRTVGTKSFGLFEIDGGEHRCVPWPLRPWNARLQARASRRNDNSHNFSMPPDALRHMMIAYICPRPVVLVSVVAEGHSNVFPMDLIGPLGPECFTLALRSTNISIDSMRNCGRVALAGVRAEDKNIAYKLGEHHKEQMKDWQVLPFPILKTGMFGLPAAANALNICEMEIKHCETIGSHSFFVGEIRSEVSLADGDQLHHTAGFHQYFRQRRGDPFRIA